MQLQFGKRRATVLNVKDEMGRFNFSPDEIKHFENYDLIYRTLCAILYNYVPTSGHPGGSISSGRFVERIIFDTMTYDFTNPNNETADIISYAAGHKALGLYAMWALRNEVVRAGKPSLLPKEEKFQLRLEDLLGFRRNPTEETPLFKEYKAKALDGHPTPATPFVKLSTGASGVGVATSFGLALGAMDAFGEKNTPHVHVVEGEGGMTPGRVAEAFAFAATAGLKNLVVHLDWNQASIDSNHVTRDDSGPGDYVQWDPIEFAYLHDWNVIIVPDGKDFAQVFTAQKLLSEIKNDQPTAIVYRTTKGWKYGIEGKASHGAGHKFCSEGFYAALKECEDAFGINFPRFSGDQTPNNVEQYYFNTLLTTRKIVEANKATATFLADRIASLKDGLKGRAPRADIPNVEVMYDKNRFKPEQTPQELQLKIGDSVTIRGVLGDVLNHYNKASGGAILAAAADLLGSTSVNNIYKDFPAGYFHSTKNPLSRTLSIGGICEDAMGGILAGLSSYGKHIGAGSSYAAFIAALHHITMRLHGIGQQARVAAFGGKYHPFISIGAHTGLKTGEDGPTHADPQALQIVQENFPADVMITLTPWDPQEVWPLVTAALQARPCVITPFVTRPNEKILDRAQLKLPPASAAAKGVYAMRTADKGKKCDGTIVLQESGVTYTFVEHVLPRLDKDGLNLNIYYIASAELFDKLPKTEQENIFPEALRHEAFGITGFTLPTLYRFVTSEKGRCASLHPFMKGHYMGSGQAHKVLEEAGLDGESQYKAVVKIIKS
jgi:transketolase